TYPSFIYVTDTSPPELTPLPLPDALPIYRGDLPRPARDDPGAGHLPVAHVRQGEDDAAAGAQLGERGPLRAFDRVRARQDLLPRSEEHTSELQSLTNLVCRLLLDNTITAN